MPAIERFNLFEGWFDVGGPQLRKTSSKELPFEYLLEDDRQMRLVKRAGVYIKPVPEHSQETNQSHEPAQVIKLEPRTDSSEDKPFRQAA